MVGVAAVPFEVAEERPAELILLAVRFISVAFISCRLRVPARPSGVSYARGLTRHRLFQGMLTWGCPSINPPGPVVRLVCSAAGY